MTNLLSSPYWRSAIARVGSACDAASLIRQTQSVQEPEFDVEDLDAPRRNVLVFYGVGGIGKSTPSRALAEHLVNSEGHESDWSPLEPQAGRVVPVRVDLARDSGGDFESLVLALRLAAADLGQPMSTFDIAFQRYWDRNYPGEPLDEYLRRRTWFSRFPGSRSLSGQMQSALADAAQAVALPGTAGGLGRTSIAVVGSCSARATASGPFTRRVPAARRSARG
ncbi:hypothetical protein [Streptomyces antimycoticus]|uniref:hypothetical protein n=1 Tax=Streptomyces antimycoticus TaxID=68175 RepID=UPI003866EF21|nr:hypothetical protein OG751_28670 [Streptomyces antimycoticus]